MTNCTAAIELLSVGELIGLPTETVYGLAADATNADAVAKIFALKKRPQFNPLIAHVGSMDMAAAQADDNADASIGNVTGSNSVNVFLGLGLPWTIAALYWGGADDDSRAEWMKRYGRGKDSISFDFYKPDDDGDTGPSALPYVVSEV